MLRLTKRKFKTLGCVIKNNNNNKENVKPADFYSIYFFLFFEKPEASKRLFTLDKVECEKEKRL